MSYRTHHLGAFQGGDSFPSGTLVVGGFEVVGLPSSSASQAVTRLRDAITSSFPSGRVAAPATSGSNAGRPTVGWGPAFGVASGKLYAVISTTADGVTGGQINSMLVATARDLGTRLGLQVRLINAHTTGGAAPLPALTPDLDPSGQIVQGTSPLVIAGIAVAGLVTVAGALYFVGRRRVAPNRRMRRNGIVWKDSPFTPGRLYSRSGFEWDPSTGALYRLHEGGRRGNDPSGTWKKIGTHRSADAAANAALKFIARRDAAYDKTVARRRSSRRP